MAWLKSYKIVRPNTDTLFFDTPDNVKTYIKETYEDTGKCISFGTVFSEDNLTLTKSRVFNTKDDREAWEADSTIQSNRTAFKSYCSSNNHTITGLDDKDI